MNFISYLTSSAEEINQELVSFLSAWLKISDKQTKTNLTPILKQFVKSVEGGKGLRGTLVKIGYQLTDARQTKEILKAAMALELLHTALLIQDDIVDRSPLRRAKPTLYKTLGGNHYAVSQSFFLGNAGYFLANKLIADSRFDERRKIQALSVFSQIVIDTIIGEMLDIELSLPKMQKREKDVLIIHKLKAASYTIIGPLTLGAILAGADEKTLAAIKTYGENIGIAFQIQDDILGVFGEEKTIGKSITSDIEENKNTLLITYALKNASPEQKNILRRYYGKGRINKKELLAIRNVFIESGSLEYCQKRANEYVYKGKNNIPKMTKNRLVQQLLQELAEFMTNREK